MSPVFRRYAEQRSVESPSYPLTSQALVDLFSRANSAGVSVDEESALAVPAVYRATSLITSIAAGMPIKGYRDRNGERDLVRVQVLETPYPYVTPFEFWQLAYTDLLLWGNVYVYKVFNELGDTVVRLLRIPPHRVTVEQDEQTPLNPGGKWYRIDGGADRYGPAEIMHVRDFGPDPMIGLGRIGVGAEAIGVAIAAEQTAAKMFGDGLMFAGILTSDQNIDQQAAETIGARFRKMLGGGTGAKIPVLGRGTSFEKISMAADEAQFTEARSFQVLEVARLFGVDPALLFDPSAVMNYGESQKQAFLDFTMERYLRQMEQAISLHLTPRGQFCEYVRGAFLRADTATRYQTYAIASQFGLLTRNEIRGLENYPPIPGLDDPLTPVNLGGAANGQAEPGVSPAPDAAPAIPAEVTE